MRGDLERLLLGDHNQIGIRPISLLTQCFRVVPGGTHRAAHPVATGPPARRGTACRQIRAPNADERSELAGYEVIEELLGRTRGLEHMDGKVLTMLCDDPSLGLGL